MRTRTLSLIATGALVLTACAGPDDPDPGAAGPADDGTGSYSDVEGAQEESEAQYRLVLADASDGSVVVLDLLSEETELIDGVEGVQGIRTDGRFAYLQSPTGTGRVVDSGVWTWDHGDHSHYYRASTRLLDAAVPAGAAAGAFNQPTVVLDDGAGTATVLDRPALERGEVDGLVTLQDVGGIALAAGDEVLTGARDGDGLEVHNLDGDVSEVDVACTDPDVGARTRAGLVVGCAEGAALVDPDDWTAELIAYPEGTPTTERAVGLEHRPGSTVLAALRGDAGAWSLDVRSGTWTPIDAPGVVAVSAAGEDLPVLVLDADGRLTSYDAATGEPLAETDLVEQVDPERPAPVVAVDSARAYVSDATAGVVHEVDYNDDLRVARTLEVDVTPSLMVKTGW